MFNAKTWRDGEAIAQDYLKNNHYKIVGCNEKLAGAEVDIVAIFPKKARLDAIKKQLNDKQMSKDTYNLLKKQARDVYVFVEVKSRTTMQFGDPEEAVTKQKQQHIKRFARAYIMKNHLEEQEIRFDVISVLIDEEPIIEHFVDAF